MKFFFTAKLNCIIYNLRRCKLAEEVATKQQNLVIRSKLASIVMRHNAIIDLCTDIMTPMKNIVLLHFLSAAMEVGIGLLDLLLVSI